VRAGPQAAVPPSEEAAARPCGAVAAEAPPCAAVVPPSWVAEAVQPSAEVAAGARPCAAAVRPSGVAEMELPSWAEAEPPAAVVAPERRGLPAEAAAPRVPRTAAGLAGRQAAVEAAEQALRPASTAQQHWVAACLGVADRAERLRQWRVSRGRRPALAALRVQAARSD
jgi:hypothetical protein